MLKSTVIVTPEQGGGPQALFPDASVLASSGLKNWKGIDAERLRLTAETSEHHHDAHFLTLQLGPPARMEWKEGRRHLTARTLPGQFTLIGAGIPHEVRYEGADVLAVSLADELVRPTIEELIGSVADQWEFVSQNGTYDAQVERFGMLLKNEIEAGCPSGRLFGEAIGQALAAHLVAHYGVQTPGAIEDAEGKLSPRQLSRALDFMEANLSRDLSLTEIATATGLSAYHFARRFKATVGVAPHAYLIQRRIERSKELLTHTDLPIAQIAAMVGFAHQSHLTRHFRQHVGTTPARFR